MSIVLMGSSARRKKIKPTTRMLLIHGGGANGSTTFVDATGKSTITQTGGTTYSTADSKFTTSSIAFVNDRLDVSPETNFDVGDLPFTIEFFIKWSSLPSTQYQTILSKRGSSASYAPYLLGVRPGGNLFVGISSLNGSWNISSAATNRQTVSAGVWYHIALVRNGSTFTLYLDGVGLTVGTSSAALLNTADTLRIGSDNSSYYFTGYMEEISFSKGAVYTGDFTPPTAPFSP